MHKNSNPKEFLKEFLKQFQTEFQKEFQKWIKKELQKIPKKIPQEFPKKTIERIIFTKKILVAHSILNSRLEFEILVYITYTYLTNTNTNIPKHAYLQASMHSSQNFFYLHCTYIYP